jgi:hypothetical protein
MGRDKKEAKTFLPPTEHFSASNNEFTECNNRTQLENEPFCESIARCEKEVFA